MNVINLPGSWLAATRTAGPHETSSDVHPVAVVPTRNADRSHPSVLRLVG